MVNIKRSLMGIFPRIAKSANDETAIKFVNILRTWLDSTEEFIRENPSTKLTLNNLDWNKIKEFVVKLINSNLIESHSEFFYSVDEFKQFSTRLNRIENAITFVCFNF